jgi:hypothetical protein
MSRESPCGKHNPLVPQHEARTLNITLRKYVEKIGKSPEHAGGLLIVNLQIIDTSRR